MKKTISSIMAVVMASTIFVGCNQSSQSMEKIQNIGDNINKISENVQSIDTQEIVDNANHTAEAANEIGQWYEEEAAEVAKAIEEGTEEAAQNEYIESLDEIDLSKVIDEEAVAELILEPIVSQIESYVQDENSIFAQAGKKRDEGLIMIQEGLEILNRLRNETELTDEVIEQIVNGATLIVSGSNEISEGANVFVQESAKAANEVISQAQLLGINSPELDALKEGLEDAQNIQLYAFSKDVVNSLEDAKIVITDARDFANDVANGTKNVEVEVEVEVTEEDIEALLEMVPTYMEEAKSLVASANEAAKFSQDFYKEIDANSQQVVETVKELSKDSDMQVAAETAIKSYENVGEFLESIPTERIEEVEKDLDKLIRFTQKVDYTSIVMDFFK